MYDVNKINIKNIFLRYILFFFSNKELQIKIGIYLIFIFNKNGIS